ncbi:MAG: Type 1 glutamine amidotransferase-like domain-containing protein [Patescibacteria group bacterium]
MKLYLSSYRIGNDPKKLIELFSANKKAAVIANAMDFLEKSERDKNVKQEIDDLTKLGLIPEELDLRNYFNESKDLNNKLNTYGLVWVRGGNTFILRRAMEQSGFDKLLRKKIKDPDFVYAGYSAGACVISPTLYGLELVDNPHRIPAKYKSKVTWNGVGIIDFFIVPHYRSNHQESHLVEKVVKYYIQKRMQFKTLRDGEVIVIAKSNKL